MDIYIFDQSFEQIGMVNTYISLQWKEEYTGKGSFTLICSDTEQNVKLLQMNYYLYQNNKNTAMRIRYIEYDSEESTVTVCGYTTLDLISQRVIYPVRTITNFETGMYSLVERFLKGSESKRNISNFTTERILNGYKGFTYSRETQFTGTDLLEALTALAEEGELGFYMKFDWRNKRHVFTVYQGNDLTQGNGTYVPQIFAEGFGNLQNTIIIDDMSEFKNVAYVAGAGEGTARIYVEVGSATGINRNELYVDARDLQKEYTDDDGKDVSLTTTSYKAILTARGKDKLNQYSRAKSFNGEVSNVGFRDKYYLGDVVSIKSDRYKIRMDTRITQYTEVTEKNKTKLTLTLGNPEIKLF